MCFIQELLHCCTIYPLYLNINKLVSKTALVLWFYCFCPFCSNKTPGDVSLQTVFEVVYPRDRFSEKTMATPLRSQATVWGKRPQYGSELAAVWGGKNNLYPNAELHLWNSKET